MRNIKVKYYNASDDWDGRDKGTKRNRLSEENTYINIYTKWTDNSWVETAAAASGDFEPL